MVTIGSPFCGYNTTYYVELNGEDLSCYSNKIVSVSLRKWPYDHRLTNKAYLSAFNATNISRSFTYKMAAKVNWHRYGTKLRHRHSMYMKVKCVVRYPMWSVGAGCSSPFLRPWPWRINPHGQCDARPTVTFPPVGYNIITASDRYQIILLRDWGARV